MLDLTFLSEYLSWLTQDLISKILSNEWANNIPTASALPSFDGDASILSTIWVFAVVEPTPVGEIIASIATGIILPVQIYRASSFFSSGVAMRKALNEPKCYNYWLQCSVPWQCGDCYTGCMVNLDGCWNCDGCPLPTVSNCLFGDGLLCT